MLRLWYTPVGIMNYPTPQTPCIILTRMAFKPYPSPSPSRLQKVCHASSLP